MDVVTREGIKSVDQQTIVDLLSPYQAECVARLVDLMRSGDVSAVKLCANLLAKKQPRKV